MSEQDIFLAAIAIQDVDARKAYLDKACAKKVELRRRIEELLRVHASAGQFLETPAIAQMFAELSADSPVSQTTEREASPKTVQFNSERSPEQIESGLGSELKFLASPTVPGSLGRLGHYEIHEVLGFGAFGIVLKAFDEKLHRMVAIKVMSASLASTSPPRKRFLREARASAAIRHENVVAIHAVEEQPIPYLVMEHIPGYNLQQVLEQHGPLSVEEVVQLGLQIARGLAAAHAQGLIHRDIKPANILLENGIGGRVKLTDFGLARAVDDANLTQSGIIAGTPMYMSPEQANSGSIDQRSDLFSFGSVLYAIFSGRPPFRATSTMAVLKRVVEDSPRPLDEIVSGAPKWLCEIIAKLQAKNPDDRFASANEVAELFAKCLSDIQANRQIDLPRLTEGLETSAIHQSDLKSTKVSTPQTNSKQSGQHKGRLTWWTSIAATLALLGFGFGMTEATGVTHLTMTVIRIANGTGTLVIESDDPELVIEVVGTQLTISGAGVQELKLDPGSYTVLAKKNGEPVKQELVEISRGGRRVLRVTMESSGPIVHSEMAIRVPSVPGSEVPERDPISEVKVVAPQSAQRMGPVSLQRVAMDLTPPAPLGTWPIGPEPPWFMPQFGVRIDSLRDGVHLPGLLERPAILPGILRWNAASRWPSKNIIKVGYSPDGNWLAVASTDGHLRIYAGDTMKLATLIPGRAGEHGIVDFSWHPDNNRLAITADDLGWATSFRIVSRTGQLLFEEQAVAYGTVAWSKSGKWIAEGILDRLVLRREDGSLERILLDTPAIGPHNGQAITWSPDNLHFACHHFDGKVRIWNIQTGESEVIANVSPAKFGPSLDWSSTGRLVICHEKGVLLYHPDEKITKTVDIDPKLTIVNAAWHPDGTRGFSTDGYQTLFSWDSEGVSKVQSRDLEWQAARFISVSRSGDIALAHIGVHKYSTHTSKVEFRAPFKLHHVSKIAWTVDGRHLACGVNYATGLPFWSVDGKRIDTFHSSDPDFLDIKCGPTGAVLLASSSKPGVYLKSGIEQAARKILPQGAHSLDWDPAGQYMVVGTDPGNVVILDASGEVVKEIKAGTGLTQVAWSPSSEQIAIHCERQLYFCKPAEEWKLIPFAVTKHTPGDKESLVWSPDGKLLSVLGEGWFTHEGKRIDTPSRTHAVQWRRDGVRYLNDNCQLAFPSSGTQLTDREFNEFVFPTIAIPQIHPRGNLIAIPSMNHVSVCREADLQPHWVSVLFPELKSVTFSAAGEIIDGDPAIIDQQIIYFGERERGRIEIFSPSEFHHTFVPPNMRTVNFAR